MTVRAKRGVRTAPPTVELSRAELWAVILPIVQRVPAYVRLGWALLKTPALARRHKSILYFTILYTLSPLHMLMAPIPVVAQLDSIVLLLLGIRQALARCPKEVVDRYLDRYNLLPGQMDKDLNVATFVALRTVGRIVQPIGSRARFAGNVAHGFTRRLIQRLPRIGNGV